MIDEAKMKENILSKNRVRLDFFVAWSYKMRCLREVVYTTYCVGFARC